VPSIQNSIVRYVASFVVLVAVYNLIPSVAHAASTPGVTISPAFQEPDLPASQAQLTFDIVLQNNTPLDLTFHLNEEDFGNLDQSGGIAFLGQSSGKLTNKYALVPWMKLGSNTVQVPGFKSVSIPVTIENEPSLAPGGHYAAVLATLDSSPQGGSKGPSIGLNQVLASMVLLTKEGGLIQKLSISNQSSDARFWHLPSQITQRFHNSGNVHLTPYGVVEVKDPAGHIVERNAIDPGSDIILPGSYRLLTTDFLNVDTAWMPGRYRLVSTYNFDGSSASLTYVTTFWYAGLLIVWFVTILALVAIGLWGWWLWYRNRAKS
jgi:hypothetical protein